MKFSKIINYAITVLILGQIMLLGSCIRDNSECLVGQSGSQGDSYINLNLNSKASSILSTAENVESGIASLRVFVYNSDGKLEYTKLYNTPGTDGRIETPLFQVAPGVKDIYLVVNEKAVGVDYADFASKLTALGVVGSSNSATLLATLVKYSAYPKTSSEGLLMSGKKLGVYVPEGKTRLNPHKVEVELVRNCARLDLSIQKGINGSAAKVVVTSVEFFNGLNLQTVFENTSATSSPSTAAALPSSAVTSATGITITKYKTELTDNYQFIGSYYIPENMGSYSVASHANAEYFKLKYYVDNPTSSKEAIIYINDTETTTNRYNVVRNTYYNMNVTINPGVEVDLYINDWKDIDIQGDILGGWFDINKVVNTISSATNKLDIEYASSFKVSRERGNPYEGVIPDWLTINKMPKDSPNGESMKDTLHCVVDKVKYLASDDQEAWFVLRAGNILKKVTIKYVIESEEIILNVLDWEEVDIESQIHGTWLKVIKSTNNLTGEQSTADIDYSSNKLVSRMRGGVYEGNLPSWLNITGMPNDYPNGITLNGQIKVKADGVAYAAASETDKEAWFFLRAANILKKVVITYTPTATAPKLEIQVLDWDEIDTDADINATKFTVSKSVLYMDWYALGQTYTATINYKGDDKVELLGYLKRYDASGYAVYESISSEVLPSWLPGGLITGLPDGKTTSGTMSFTYRVQEGTVQTTGPYSDSDMAVVFPDVVIGLKCGNITKQIRIVYDNGLIPKSYLVAQGWDTGGITNEGVQLAKVKNNAPTKFVLNGKADYEDNLYNTLTTGTSRELEYGKGPENTDDMIIYSGDGTIASVCRSLGDEWSLPSSYEMQNIVKNYKVLGPSYQLWETTNTHTGVEFPYYMTSSMTTSYSSPSFVPAVTKTGAVYNMGASTKGYARCAIIEPITTGAGPSVS